MSTLPTPSCPFPHCHVPSGVCAYGELDYRTTCKFFGGEGAKPAEEIPADPVTEFPWTGGAFGLDDLEWLVARGRPLLLAPVGAHNAGKTTFLTANYLGLCHGLGFEQHEFSGSFTLGAWENLAGYMRYAPEGIGPQFPPHTANTGERVSGLLHFAVRRRDGALVDMLLADAPGEWFNKWATHTSHEEAAGARWIAKHADGFMLFVDSEELAGANRGVARDDLFKLAQRLEEHLEGRPLAVVWSKSDWVVRPTIKAQVENRLKQLFPSAPVFTVTVRADETGEDAASKYLEIISWLLRHQTKGPTMPSPAVLRDTVPFLAFRG